MTGIIDVGGGMRAIYGAGVLDRCLDENIAFDYCCGVSAGGANMCAYLAGQRGRNYRYYHDYSFRKEYMSLENVHRKGAYLDLNYVYATLSNSGGEDPLDFAAMMNNPARLVIVATDAKTNTPVYFTKDDMEQDRYEIIKATCSIPIVCNITLVGGREYFDGGLTDPLPIEKALADGCGKVVVVLTRPVDYVVEKTGERIAPIINRLMKKYPESAKSVFTRHDVYAKQLERCLELQKEGKVLIVAPDDTCGVDTLKRTPESLDALYRKGYEDGGVIGEFVGA
ncbi:MAG: patatin family protein [Clostridia bacterium]|nr:patatin family protein [Clostridia bacterium]